MSRKGKSKKVATAYAGFPDIRDKDFFPICTLGAERMPVIVNPMFNCCAGGGAGFAQPSPITKNVFLGDMEDASDFGKLKRLNITHIVNVTEKPPVFPDEFLYFSLSLRDQPDVQIAPFFFESTTWIRDAIAMKTKDGEECNVLIHCKAGVSRSVTICAAYLMRIEGMQLHSAVEWMYHQRPVISPNEGFKLQLAIFEAELFFGSSVVRSHKPRWNFYELNRVKQKRNWKEIAMPPGAPDIRYPCCIVS